MREHVLFCVQYKQKQFLAGRIKLQLCQIDNNKVNRNDLTDSS